MENIQFTIGVLIMLFIAIVITGIWIKFANLIGDALGFSRTFLSVIKKVSTKGKNKHGGTK